MPTTLDRWGFGPWGSNETNSPITTVITVVSAELVGPLQVRVTFSAPPLAFDPSVAGDALNPTYYALTGPQAASFQAAAPVSGHLNSVDLFMGAALPVGTWTVTVSSDVQDLLGANLTAPFDASFSLTVAPTATDLDGGAEHESVIRRHLNPALKGPTWDNIIAALEGDEDNLVGDAYVQDFVRKAFNQLLPTAASGSYLLQRASDVGIRPPENVAMDDEALRALIRAVSNDRLTHHVIHDVLEAFYGPEALRASLPAGPTEPYAMQDGDDLDLEFGAGRLVHVDFNQRQFARIGAATATEVAATINRAMRAAGVQGIAAVTSDPATSVNRVVVYSDVRGTPSSIRVTGGRAQVALRFPLDVFPALTAPFGSWIIASSPVLGRLRVTSSVPSAYDLSKVQVGDRVLIYGREFPSIILGTHDVLDLSVTYPGGVLSQWFEIDGSPLGAATVVQRVAGSLVFLRPTKRTIHAQASRAYAVQSGGRLRLRLPATTQVVQRGAGKAGYLASSAAIGINAVDRDATGRVLLTLASAHGLAAGQHVLVDGLRAAPAMPAVSAGAASATLGASHG